MYICASIGMCMCVYYIYIYINSSYNIYILYNMYMYTVVLSRPSSDFSNLTPCSLHITSTPKSLAFQHLWGSIANGTQRLFHLRLTMKGFVLADLDLCAYVEMHILNTVVACTYTYIYIYIFVCAPIVWHVL